ncbi:MAG TPA: amidohydrolase family protein [Bryobacteraceae bacterium]|nr:amidohydrolase family protein [Bryobacteraceae bacterium]
MSGRLLAGALVCASALAQNLAIRGGTIYTMAGAPVTDGVVVITNGKIAAVGAAASVQVPAGYQVLTAKIVTPGLVDAHTTVGLSGYLNAPTDQDQLETSAPMQPELRAVDAYDSRERLIEWVRSFGVTTMNTGHAPGALVSGQLMVVKTRGNTVEEATVKPVSMVAASLGDQGRARGEGKSPGTRAKEIAMLREQFLKAQDYQKKLDKAAAEKDKDKPAKAPDRDLRLEVFTRILKGELPLLVTANRERDIMNALRLAHEFHFHLILDGAAEADLVMDQIQAAGVPVIVHATMQRQLGEEENASFETAAHLQAAGIPWALQSGFEGYVPKTRVILFEAAAAAANGLTFDQALASITIDAARLIGVADRAGSLESGKDGDAALYDGDPFEYTTHCVGTVIDGKVEFQGRQ